ncbi:hypothetical protein QTP70_025534, partial [Hemibagrus guttatus]
MIIDPRRKRKEQHTPIYIGETEVAKVKTFKFLGTYISKDFTWSHNTQQLLRRFQQRLYFKKAEEINDVTVRKTICPPEDQVFCLTMVDVRKTLRRVNPRKAAGPDNIPGSVLRECAEQLADVFTDIFNISLSSAVVPTCLKTTTIIPMPKKSPVLRKAHLPPLILTTFYRGTIESILSSCITAWFGNCTVSDHKTLQRIVWTAEKIIGVSLPSIMDIFSTRCIRKANSIVDDPTHPSHTLFTLLPSGK